MSKKENLTVEYLVSINHDNIFSNCSTKSAFNNLLCSNEKIKINGSKIIYDKLELNYKIQLTEKEKIKYFHMIFKCEEIDKLKLYEEFLRGIKSVLSRVSDNGVIVLWDDISIYYCTKAYPLINRVENTMRKLLTKFMMINIGENWDKTVISDEIKQSIPSKNSKSYDYLYNTDFIKLSDFLFKEYPNITYENFNKEIKKSKDINKFNIEDIIKKSNWDRYFSKKVACEGEFLDKRWRKLYDLRCKVAHNNQLERKDYEQIKSLVEDIEPKLDGVIKKLDEINVEENFKSRVVENIVENIYPDSMYFLSQLKTLEEILNIMNIDEDSNLTFPLYKVSKILHKKGVIDTKTYELIIKILGFRNRLVHEINTENNIVELDNIIADLISCQEYLLNSPEYKENISRI